MICILSAFCKLIPSNVDRDVLVINTLVTDERPELKLKVDTDGSWSKLMVSTAASNGKSRVFKVSTLLIVKLPSTLRRLSLPSEESPATFSTTRFSRISWMPSKLTVPATFVATAILPEKTVQLAIAVAEDTSPSMVDVTPLLPQSVLVSVKRYT